MGPVRQTLAPKGARGRCAVALNMRSLVFVRPVSSQRLCESVATWVQLVLLNSISFYDTQVNLARPFRRAQTGHAKRVHKNRGCGRATGQASFEEEKHNQGRRRDGAGCGRTGSFAIR